MFQRIVHCDWSKHPHKRIMTRVDKTRDRFIISATEHVVEVATLQSRSRE